MAEQPQPWGERTLAPQDPWSNPPAPAYGPPSARPAPYGPPPAGPASAETVPALGGAGPVPSAEERAHAFSRGVAHVKPPLPPTRSFDAAHHPTGTGWPDAEPEAPRRPMSWHLQQLRSGSEWSSAGLLFAFVCWGLWALSTSGRFGTSVLVFVVAVLVAVGLFALCRVLGGLVLERQLGRVRRTARGSHLVVAAFLVGVGVAHLRQVEWLMNAWGWVTGFL